MKKPLLVWLLGNLVSIAVFAQVEREPPTLEDEPLIKLKSNRLYGKLVDSRTQKGVDAASVQVYALRKDSLITGMLTKANGDFSFRNLPAADSVRLVISAIGFTSKDQLVSLLPAGTKNNGDQPLEKDMGNIVLQPDAQALETVTVTARKPALEMGIDRKIFHAENSLTAAGGTATDLLKNIPSVNVDVNGNVQLRNNTPQLFVDGRPTILTLDQIPADDIDRVELITNPSAKYDASGGGGIINVVLKKNRRAGFNGIATIGGGSPKVGNGNLSLNIRQEKFNLFGSANYNQSGGRPRGKTLRENKKGGITDNYFNQYSTGDLMRHNRSFRFGMDYFLDNRNTLSASQNITGGNSSRAEEQQQEYLNSSRVLQRSGKRTSDADSRYKRYSTQVDFTHKFPQPGKELTANFNYNWGNGTNNYSILNSYFLPDNTPVDKPARVVNYGDDNSQQMTFKVDFENPISEHAKLETGMRSFINRQHSILSAYSVNNGAQTKLPLSNNYKYTQLINAFYVTYSNKWKGIGYQAGLRAEHSRFDGTLVDSAKKFGYEYPGKLNQFFDAVFPSLFLTKQAGEHTELQINYTRRIGRPDFWELNPFIDISDPVNLRQGNPLLRPEFINSFEFNINQRTNKGNLLAIFYLHNNPRDITRFSDTISAAQYQQLNNAAIDPNAILNTYINAQTTNRFGAEFILQHKAGKNFDLTPSVTMQYRKVQTGADKLSISNKGLNWGAKLVTSYKIVTRHPTLFNNFSVQFFGEYQSRQVIPQGYQSARFNADLALRKEFMKNRKAAVTFSINDLFNTNRFGTIYDTPAFYQDGYSRRNVRNFRLNFTYKFGKSDFYLFKKREPKTEEES
ncbi:MAG: TonB-dependent receptor [Williamsia sp.]|nr:TonB-dependent receptor [Williamsia sp.]